MEALLNILWLIIATAFVCVWRLRWVRQKRASERKRAQEWTAMTAALILLFFAVSLTDDLHSDMMLYDECSSGRRHSMACACGHADLGRASAIHGAVAALATRSASLELPPLGGRTVAVNQAPNLTATVDIPAGRAPPSSLL
jgi:threonine/homoserine/homoserine lactone efflux protein